MSLYEENLAVLRRVFPQAEEILERASLEKDEGEVLPSRKGAPTIRKDGVFLHSRHDPEREAEKLIDREMDGRADFCLFYGFGLGYHLHAFHRRCPGIPFGVVEPDVNLFRQALAHRDLRDLFLSGRMTLMLGAEPEAVQFLLERVKTLNIRTCLLRSVYPARKEYYDRTDKAVRDYLAKREINANTHNRFNRLWISNISRNAPLLSRAAGVRKLEGRFAGQGALLLAAGPGLTEVLPRLEELRERFLLVCVDTALRACLSRGIEPDITVLTDPQYWNARHLDRCRLKRSLLVSDVSTYPSVFRLTEGPLFFCSAPFPLGQYLEKRTEIKGKLQSGGSVATAAWDLIRLMGCREIYCAGLDLAFPDRQTHYRGSTFEERVHTLCGRLAPGELSGWQALHNGNPFPIRNYRGERLLTDQRMKIYISWFEKQMGDHPGVRTRNLSSRGAALEGMPPEELEALLEKPRRRVELDRLLAEASRLRPSCGETEVRAALDELARELGELASLTEEGAACSRRMTREGATPELLARLGELDRRILSMGGREIAGFFLLPLLEEFLADSAKEKTPREVLEQSVRFYGSLKESLDYHLSELKMGKNFTFS